MATKTVAFCVLSFFCCGAMYGQAGKGSNPAGDHSYLKGVVWVKVRPEHGDLVRGGRPNGRVASFGATGIRPFVANPSSVRSNARLAPHQPAVDISLYYAIFCEAGRDVKEFVASLNATGYFDLVEPVPAIRPLFNPNDADIAQQTYLDVIKAREAWDITQGTEDLVIGVVDTGGDLDHPDLQNKLYIDPNEPIDGIDNDNDGFVDNYRGWDFSGADLALIGAPGFIGDNNPSINQGGLFMHGTMVAGLAAASTNNSIGMAGVGFKTRLLFTKHFADNQPANSNYSSDLYLGMLYAATHGARIINCSWGSYNQSTIAQDIINYVTFDLGCLVIAAAGNSNIEDPIYPAAYEHVLSVASTDNDDVRAYFSNFNKTVDISAPGLDLYTTAFDDGYVNDSGTSLSAPLVSGAAALVWTLHPEYTPLQVAEQLRVSSDASLYTHNPTFAGKLGHGRLNVLRALTFASPSVRASNQRLVNDGNVAPDAGQRARLTFDFTNYLQPSSAALKATISSSSPYITIAKNTFTIGSLGASQKVNNSASPFEIQLLASLPLDQVVEILITFTDGAYSDTQLISITLPSFIEIRENNIITSLSSNGRIGYGNFAAHSNGAGFMYAEESLLFEMGLMIGTSSSVMYDNVRGTGGSFNLDFSPSGRMSKNTPGQRSFSEVSGALLNEPNPANASLGITYQSLVWNTDPHRDFIILEYKIQNKTQNPVSNVHAALFADWDVVNGGANDRAAWNGGQKIGYVYGAQGGMHPVAGIQMLSSMPQYYAIDNDQSIPDNPLGVYDGFTDAEKYTTMSGGVGRAQAGTAAGGNDVSHVVGSGPYTIPAGQTITVAFALHASQSVNGLLNSAAYADTLYNYTLKADKPVVSAVRVCKGSPAQLNATGATRFRWYRTITGGSAAGEGATFTTGPLEKDTVLYVSNADHSWESLRVPVSVSVAPIPTITTSGLTAFCAGGRVSLTSSVGDEYAWNNGATTQTIEVTTSGQYHVTVRYGSRSCTSLIPVNVTAHPLPSAEFTMTPETPVAKEAVTFKALQENVEWRWDFGDGTSSTLQNPQHTYSAIGDFTVTLDVKSPNNCMASASKFLGTVTSIEISRSQIRVYPNPVTSDHLSIYFPQQSPTAHLDVIDALGRRVASGDFDHIGDEHLVDVSALSNGIYILRVFTPDYTIEKKIVLAK